MPEKSICRYETDSKSDSELLRIRAHHLCCIQGFQGYGYSPVFVANMRAVISDLEVFPSRPIKLVTVCDAICVSCPSKMECTVQESVLSQKIRQMDLTVLKILKLDVGTVLNADEAFRLINSKLNKASHVEEVCGTCKWRQKCLWYIQAGKQESEV
ncbi:Iron-sulfur binding protein [Methanosarcina siciliae C2J]|uniref:Iron-sulfur binding protein n=2 Tax=Methanosarcina siciliae TaxID=38027 RepID=A0A0E3P8D0_9EURY|nr:DUF1284 domain-containing protein [Methanosarcina siciliae]AKB30168.1 Iron-sulfur binding protein [Methanosarcina siciliae T4/M]AKB38438.1 Iron-sulfur binding protein [Methanosarcina siciliae C2J]